MRTATVGAAREATAQTRGEPAATLAVDQPVTTASASISDTISAMSIGLVQ